MPRLPDWLEPLYDAEQMRAIDRWAIEERGVPSLDLMERAGEALAREADEVGPTGPVVVVCGPGNNGGDGFVAARLLRSAGREVRVAVTADLDKYKGDAKANLDRLPGDPPVPFATALLEGAAVVVDALLGTGFSGEVREPVRTAITDLNASAADVVACDVPSGVDASTGAVDDIAVEARSTVTFHAAKPGLWIHPGKKHAGHVVVADIGIPRRRAGRGGHRAHRGRRARRHPGRGPRTPRSSRAGTSSWWAARPASPARPAWPPTPRCARGRATSRAACPPR